jgi:hypothetical protein
VKYWYTWISNTRSITGETLIYMNIKHYKHNWWIFMYINVSPVMLVVFDIHVYEWLTSYTCSVSYSCISIFHQLSLQYLIFMYINVSPVIIVVFDIHLYHCFVKHWYTWIANTTRITGAILIYINMIHYKSNWSTIHIHTCSAWYSCISMLHLLYL